MIAHTPPSPPPRAGVLLKRRPIAFNRNSKQLRQLQTMIKPVFRHIFEDVLNALKGINTDSNRVSIRFKPRSNHKQTVGYRCVRINSVYGYEHLVGHVSCVVTVVVHAYATVSRRMYRVRCKRCTGSVGDRVELSVCTRSMHATACSTGTALAVCAAHTERGNPFP